MAGDVPVDERVFIAPDTSAVTGSVTPGARAAAAAPADRSAQDPPAGTAEAGDDPAAGVRLPGERSLHRYGRVLVLGQPADAAQPAEARQVAAGGGSDDGAVVATAGLAGLDRAETLGLEAFRLRASAAYRRAKRARPRDGQSWDMPGCTDVAPPRSTPGPRDAGSSPAAGAPTAQAAPAQVAAEQPEGATAEPLSSYLEGSVAVGLILVEGPTPDLQFTAAERTKIAAETQNGLSWLAAANPAADVTFSWDIQIVRIDRPANPGLDPADREAHWRDPAMARLGYRANFDGVYDYVEALRTRLRTRWAYVCYVTKYPLAYFAYAAIGGPRVVLSYNLDGWGPDNMDRVFAHESCHIFGAGDEYASASCSCNDLLGRFRVPNGNCETCAIPASVDCLMRGNTFAWCRFSPAHIGWGRGVSGNPVLLQSTGLGQLGNFELIVPSAFAGLTHIWENFDRPNFPWEEPWQTAQSLGRVDAVTMIQSNLQSPGPLEVCARVGASLYFLWRDSTGAFRWSSPVRIATGVAGVPSMVQGRYGGRGNFELIFPATDGGIMHMWRNHDVYGFPWSAPKRFAPQLGRVDAVSLIQGSRGGGPGCLEAVARIGSRLVHLWRDQTAQANWHTTVFFADGVTGNPVMIESQFPGARNFEVVVPSATAGLIHYWRNNQAPGTPWSGPRPFAASLGRVDAVAMIQSSFNGHLEVVARVGDRLYQMFRDVAGNWTTPNRIF